MRIARLDHQFVGSIPEFLQPGVLYVSLDYATASHLCGCGCGEEVVTPFTPLDWRLTFDGETISLHPSIGNWDLPCRSHYVIRQGGLLEAGPWSDERVAAERQRDREAKDRRFGRLSLPDRPSPEVAGARSPSKKRRPPLSWWRRLLGWG